jgi:16S rRNA (cytidine1402-2'-O)-methyltransferase
MLGQGASPPAPQFPINHLAVPLSICATPIGNLEDVTLRVLRELGEADAVLCEDTRRTRILLERHGLTASLLSYHEHNEATRTEEMLPRLIAGERVVLVSDAGLPTISDPGARLVAACIAAGVPVTVLPGPSAVETALVASGLSVDRYQFLGYLPRTEKGLLEVWSELEGLRHAAVAFESPRRLPRTLASLARILPDRKVAVCRELTKVFEEVVRGSAHDLAERFSEPPKGEITLVFDAGEPIATTDATALAAVAALVEEGLPRRRAAELVARLTGVPRNQLYRASL